MSPATTRPLSSTRSRMSRRLAVPEVLGSRSTYLPGSFGGVDGRVLKRGDVVPLVENSEQLSRERFERLKRKRGSSVRWISR